MTNEELRGNLLGLGVYLRAQSNRLDKLGHDAEADASRRHAKYIDRLVNEWTPDAPATPGMLCPRCGGCTWEAEQHPWESQPRQEMCRRCAGTGTVPAPAAPAVAEVGSRWRSTLGEVTVSCTVPARVYWKGNACHATLIEFLRDFEPVPAPPAPEPEQLWVVRLDMNGAAYYFDRYDEDGDPRFRLKDSLVPQQVTLDEAFAVIRRALQNRSDNSPSRRYGIEPAERVPA